MWFIADTNRIGAINAHTRHHRIITLMSEHTHAYIVPSFNQHTTNAHMRKRVHDNEALRGRQYRHTTHNTHTSSIVCIDDKRASACNRKAYTAPGKSWSALLVCMSRWVCVRVYRRTQTPSGHYGHDDFQHCSAVNRPGSVRAFVYPHNVRKHAN